MTPIVDFAPRKYAYFSHQHFTQPGTKIEIWRKPNRAEVYITASGSTKNPEDSGYYYPQTIQLGDMSNWEFIYEFYTEDDDPDPNGPTHMTIRELEQAA